MIYCRGADMVAFEGGGSRWLPQLSYGLFLDCPYSFRCCCTDSVENFPERRGVCILTTTTGVRLIHGTVRIACSSTSPVYLSFVSFFPTSFRASLACSKFAGQRWAESSMALVARPKVSNICASNCALRSSPRAQRSPSWQEMSGLVYGVVWSRCIRL